MCAILQTICVLLVCAVVGCNGQELDGGTFDPKAVISAMVQDGGGL